MEWGLIIKWGLIIIGIPIVFFIGVIWTDKQLTDAHRGNAIEYIGGFLLVIIYILLLFYFKNYIL